MSVEIQFDSIQSPVVVTADVHSYNMPSYVTYSPTSYVLEESKFGAAAVDSSFDVSPDDISAALLVSDF